MTSSTPSANPTTWRPDGRPATAGTAGLEAGAVAPTLETRLPPVLDVTPDHSHPPVLNLRHSGNHPLALRYSEVFQQAVLLGPLDHGRAQPALAVDRCTPFVRAAQRAVDHGLHRAGVLEAMVDVLAPYYAQVRPRHAADWLGLGADAHAELQAAPPWGAVFPWRARSVASYRKAYEDAALAENRAVGRDVGISDGWLFCGPVSADKTRIEAERILYVLRRIDDGGYQRHDGHDGDVRATALVNDSGDWRWLITAGNHRASAAAALGLAAIPVRINLVISRADVAHWRQVAQGLFTPAQALAVFDRFFDARPPACAQGWLAQAQTA